MHSFCLNQPRWENSSCYRSTDLLTFWDYMAIHYRLCLRKLYTSQGQVCGYINLTHHSCYWSSLYPQITTLGTYNITQTMFRSKNIWPKTVSTTKVVVLMPQGFPGGYILWTPYRWIIGGADLRPNYRCYVKTTENSFGERKANTFVMLMLLFKSTLQGHLWWIYWQNLTFHKKYPLFLAQDWMSFHILETWLSIL